MEWIYYFGIHMILISSVKGNVHDISSHPHSNEGHSLHPEHGTNNTENGSHGKLA